MPNVTVKWGREKLNVDADLNEMPLVFKSQLFALTGVMPERQKVMIKGKILGDDNWNGITLPDGAVIMMMGSSDAPPKAPTVKPQFLEDMTEAEAVAAVKLPVGIKNLGNTCYMNATLQCFKTIPELTTALNKCNVSIDSALSSLGADSSAKSLTVAVRDLYRMMDNTNTRRTSSVIPLVMLQGANHLTELAKAMNGIETRELEEIRWGYSLNWTVTFRIFWLVAVVEFSTCSNICMQCITEVQVLHHELPQFAARDDHGQWMQQDANECWTELLRAFQSQLKLPKGSFDHSISFVCISFSSAFTLEYFSAAAADDADNSTIPFVTNYMEGRFKVQMKNLESDVEPVVTSSEKFLQLSCFLGHEVKYVQLGIKNKMTEEIEKNSELLGRNARYEKKTLIDRLPAYLSIQMVRFFYKEKDNVNAKVLKDVKFPMSLDVYDMCTPELQAKLLPMREAFKKEDDDKLEKLRASKGGEDTTANNKEDDPSNAAKKEDEKKSMPYSFEDDPGSNNSGFYELQGVITHKGRSSNSGHYVGWVRTEGDHWAMCDDDEVHPVPSEDILRLSGGGDWHCAYLLLYGPRILRK
ncbi:unnamed protein product [Anisakis simplex]|uniref:Ubiquitin carboxyl-terminal hydrolase n=1 Tax=Anisakis simplex TaxID=6269 RepID=A0A0M3JTK2_ANISI|nr:unnamed protein product [Anisakis simplex]